MPRPNQGLDMPRPNQGLDANPSAQIGRHPRLFYIFTRLRTVKEGKIPQNNLVRFLSIYLFLLAGGPVYPLMVLVRALEKRLI